MKFDFDHIRKTLVGSVEAQIVGPGGKQKKPFPLNFQGAGLKRFLEALHNLSNGTPRSSAFYGNGEALIIMQTTPDGAIGCSLTQGLFSYTFLLPGPEEVLKFVEEAMGPHFKSAMPKMTTPKAPEVVKSKPPKAPRVPEPAKPEAAPERPDPDPQASDGAGSGEDESKDEDANDSDSVPPKKTTRRKARKTTSK